MARELGDRPDSGADAGADLPGEYLDDLERRYAPPAACRVCGHAMVRGDVLHDRGILWMCGSPEAAPWANRGTFVTSAAALHHAKSRTVTEPPDEDMLALIRERRLMQMARVLADNGYVVTEAGEQLAGEDDLSGA